MTMIMTNSMEAVILMVRLDTDNNTYRMKIIIMAIICRYNI